jgi:hypothetical protein
VYLVPPPVTRTIHSMEHAAVVVWVDRAAPAADRQPGPYTELAQFFADPQNNDHVIVAPYAYPDQGSAGQLPEGITMALTAWHRQQLCQRISLAVAQAFVRDFRFDPGEPDRYRGDAPELGVSIG